MASQEEFLEYVAELDKVNAEEAGQLLQAQAGDNLFIARETCPYCRKFINRLMKVVKEKDLTVHFLHAQPADEQEAQAVQALRDQYGVPTVPALLYAGQDGVDVVCDSSLSPEAIIEFVHA